MKIVGKGFKIFYTTFCCALVLVLLSCSIALFYNRLFYGKILDYGTYDRSNVDHQIFFDITSNLYTLALLFVFLSPIIGIIALVTRTLSNSRLLNVLSLVSFFVLLLLLLLDPFGIWKYYDE